MSTYVPRSINIRPAIKSDNFYAIARCIYMTDTFIYPAAFGPDAKNAVHAIASLMMIDGNLFDYRRLVVATIDGDIKGVLMYSEQGTTWSQAVCDEAVSCCIYSMTDFQYVSQAYFEEAATVSSANHIEIVACCVAPEARRHGLANRMFQYIIEAKPNHIMNLDVLANNQAAIALYSKFGFVITRSYKGFSMRPETQPNCYHMVRNEKSHNHDQST